MTQFYTTQEAARILGLTPAEVNKLREENKLHGYRDGMDWKFKAEDVHRLKAEGLSREPSEEGAEPDVLLSELELGGAGSSKSGTVISGEAAGLSPAESDLRLAEPKQPPATKFEAKEELDLALEEDLPLAESDIAPKKSAAPTSAQKSPPESSDIGLAPVTEEEEVVIGGSSGSGSDVTMGADSGISLVDPSDSGLSLEEPLDLAPPGEETLELGEDDMITLAEEEADLESPTQLRSEEFDLTGLEEPGEEEAESGSQVIALEEVEEAAPVAGVAAGRAPMLEEELVGPPAISPIVTPLGAPPVAAPAEMAAAGALAAPALPEAPYTIWNVLSLALCVLILAVTGMMMFDMIRNIWSWDSQTVLSSPIMDGILSLFEK
ncbi:MAG: excisionase family DNA-binding protein [Thermoguttaceae bacterium]|nr:excisionase family DNA-binding protein [Thermoguttaceae bacterium]MDW8037966.1 excisionase family DNA-binding protein [Thermoguttaceae bacterium]